MPWFTYASSKYPLVPAIDDTVVRCPAPGCCARAKPMSARQMETMLRKQLQAAHPWNDDEGEAEMGRARSPISSGLVWKNCWKARGRPGPGGCC